MVTGAGSKWGLGDRGFVWQSGSMQVATRKARTILNVAAWDKVRVLYERGETNMELGRSFKVSPRTIGERAAKFGWERKKEAGEVETGVSGVRAVSVSESPTGLPNQPVSDVVSLDLHENSETEGVRLIAKSQTETPELFQAGISAYAKALVIQGAPGIAPPKTIAELKLLNDMIRKADGLDAKDKNPAPAGSVRPMRTLSRRISEPVEAVTVAVTGTSGDPVEEEIDEARMLGEDPEEEFDEARMLGESQ